MGSLRDAEPNQTLTVEMARDVSFSAVKFRREIQFQSILVQEKLVVKNKEKRNENKRGGSKEDKTQIKKCKL